MRCGTVIAGLLLVGLAAVPFAIVAMLEDAEEKKRQEKSVRDRKVYVTPGQPGTTRPIETPTTPVAPPVVTRVAPPVESVTPADPGSAVTFVGALRLPGSKRAINRQLTLTTAVGERVVFTNESGDFSFVVSSNHFPMTLSDSSAAPIYTQRSFREAQPTYLNIELLRPTRRFKGLIQPRAVSASRFADGSHRVRVFGETALEAGQSLFAYLLSSTKVVSSGLHYHSSDGVLADMLLPARNLHSGRFQFKVAWKPSSADPAMIDTVREYVGLSPADGLPGELDARGFIYIGRPEEESAQEKEIRDYCRKALVEVQSARDLILIIAWQVRAREVATTAEEKEDWHQEIAFVENKPRQQALAKYPPFQSSDGMWRKGGMKLRRWRKLIDEKLPERWKPLRDPSNFPYPDKYPEIAVRVPALFAELNRLTRFESRLLYEAMGESPDERDYVDSNFGPWDERRLSIGRLNRVSKELIEQLDLGRTRD